VLLSKTGSRIADQVLRTRRLWATFLADHLGFSPADADDQACHLEHATSAEAANRLAAYLGNPEVGPLGRRIPSADTSAPRRAAVRLTEVPVGESAEVVALTAAARSLEFLIAEKIEVGTRLTVTASGDSGLLIELAKGDVLLNGRLAAQVEVRITGNDDASA
jgi:DtxR family Mn-dependent transcriptional regulator